MEAKLREIGCIQTGDFTLKSGKKSNYYVDLRRLVSYPTHLRDVADEVYKKIQENTPEFDYICGVPYGAIPLATTIAITHNIPMIMLRKETKAHGTKKLIEGVYGVGDRVVLVEDVVTTGGSVLEAANMLEEGGLTVLGVYPVVDRGIPENFGLNCSALLRI